MEAVGVPCNMIVQHERAETDTVSHKINLCNREFFHKTVSQVAIMV